jgi:ribose transport system ATP-binding protein
LAQLFELSRVSKWFGATRALGDVDFDVRAGEVHVLAGENGAGKSTLIKILSGVYSDFDGTLSVAGVPQRFRTPADAVRAGLATIHQELSLIGAMSVTDNLLLGRAGRFYDWIDRRERGEAARAMLAALSIEVDPDAAVESLPLGTRQLIEIARALALDARVIVMDEPTSALGESECERLFERIGALLERGAGIVYISHRIEEIYRLAHRITVLRDGARVCTEQAAALPRAELIRAMTGAELAERGARRSSTRGERLLRVEGLCVHDQRVMVQDVSFTLQRGEVLGVAGLEGSGASELLHGAFGSVARSAGSVRIEADTLVASSPSHAIENGLILLGSDRASSVVRELGVAANLVLSSLRDCSRFGWFDRARELATARELIARLSIATASPFTPAGALSGGNQQKVAFGRCLLARPRVLLLDDPTRGIDVGAKAQVYTLIDELAGSGLGIVLRSSELDELRLLCDRVLVMFRGSIALELAGGDFSRERVLHAAMGGTA